MPVLLSDGTVYGTLCAVDPQPQPLPAAKVNLLQVLARIVATQIERDLAGARANAAEQARAQLLSTLSHDLKNPLTAIVGNTQLIQRRLARAPENVGGVTAQLERIQASAEQMLAMLDDLGSVARGETAVTKPAAHALLDLAVLVKHVVAAYEGTTAQGIELETEAEVMVTGDRNDIQRVTMNLLGNAIKFSPAGSRIVVRVAREKEAARAVAVLRVRDEGMGIPPADLSQIFTRFHRGANVVGRIGGTGIGLASAQEIVERHGGTITVESSLGHGSTFTVRLPVV